MLVLITYDVNTQDAAGVRRLNKIAKLCVKYGQRVQNSVFEGELTKSELKIVVDGLKNIIDEDTDSVIIYKLMMEESLERDVLGIEKSPIDEIL